MQFVGPHRNRLSFAVVGKAMIVASIIALLFWGSPTAVFGRVAAVHVLSVESVATARRFSHISEEILEKQPFCIDRDAATAVSSKGFVAAIETTSFHRHPNTIDASARTSVSFVLAANIRHRIDLQTATALRSFSIFSSQVMASDRHDILALASTNPYGTPFFGTGETDHLQPTEILAFNVNTSRADRLGLCFEHRHIFYIFTVRLWRQYE